MCFFEFTPFLYLLYFIYSKEIPLISDRVSELFGNSSVKAIHELRSLTNPPSGFHEVVYFLGTVITPQKMLGKGKKNFGKWQDVVRVVLGNIKEAINGMKNFSYKDIMNIPSDVIKPIKCASLSENYMNENIMMMKS